MRASLSLTCFLLSSAYVPFRARLTGPAVHVPSVTRAAVRCLPLALAAEDSAEDAAKATAASAAIPLTPCGGVMKTVLQPISKESELPPAWGAMVRVRFTGRFPNGTIFDDAHAEQPYEFQLNTGTVVDGMERGVRSMRPGERASLQCDPKYAYDAKGVGSRIPPNATLVYEVELIDWREGPLVENDTFDIDMYKKALVGKAATQGTANAYTWAEGGEDVTLWLPLRDGEGARDVSCNFRPRELSVCVGALENESSRVVAGTLKGRSVPDESYWVIEDDHPQHGRALQVVLAKAGAYVRWDGVLIADDDQPDDW